MSEDTFLFEYKKRSVGHVVGHAHAGVEFHFCEAGRGYFDSGLKRTQLVPGRVTLIHAPTYHRIVSIPYQNYFRTVMHLSKQMIEPIGSFIRVENEKWLPTENNPIRQFIPGKRDLQSLRQALREVQNELHLKGTNITDPKISIILANIFYILSRGESPPETIFPDVNSYSKQLIDGVLACIDNDLSQFLSVDDVAEVAGVSTGHLRRLFRQLLGIGPGEYLFNKRMELAKGCLDNGMLVTDVARLCGYANVTSFGRAFKGHTGFSPSAYARRDAIRLSSID